MTRRRLLATLALIAPLAAALGALIMHVSYSSQGKSARVTPLTVAPAQPRSIP